MWYIIIGVVILYLLYKFVTDVVAPLIYSFGEVVIRSINFLLVDLWTSVFGNLVIACIVCVGAGIILTNIYRNKARVKYAVAELDKQRRKTIIEHVLREASFEKLLPFYSTSTGIGKVIVSRVFILSVISVLFFAIVYALCMPGFFPSIVFSVLVCIVLLIAAILYSIQRFGGTKKIFAGIAGALVLSGGLFAASVFFSFDGQVHITIPSISFMQKNKVKNNSAQVFDLELSKKIPLGFVSVKTSSNLPAGEKFSYGPKLIFDNEPSTAWIEGNPAEGIDETIFVVLKDEIRPSSAFVINGYASRQLTWKRNDRIRTLRVTYYSLPQEAVLEDIDVDSFIVSTEYVELEDSMDTQKWKTSQKPFNAFELRIVDVISGENGFKDCSLSEFGFLTE